MFYSQLLLSKKGALGIIWMAAHCHKRLKKDQVQQTNISSTVDKILDDEVSVVTHRILAFLLLGIVRIYSKKVEYLYNDCHEILNRLRSFKTQKNARAGVSDSHTQRHYHSITLPEKFELDAFDLGLGQDAMGGKIRSHEQMTLADVRRKGSRRSGLFSKDSIPISEAYSAAQTPPRDVFEAHHKYQDLLVKPSSNANTSLANVEVLRRSYRSLENCVDPVQLDENENEQMHNHLANKDWKNCPTNEASSDSDSDSDSAVRLSNNRHHSLPSSGLELMVLDEAEKEQLNNRPSHVGVSPNFRGRIQEEQMHFIDLRTNIQGPTNNMESNFAVSLSNNAILRLPSLEMLRGNMFTLEDRLEPMVLDEAEKEQLYDWPSNRNTSSNVLGLIQDVELNSVANQSHEGSNPVENLDILHESNFSVEHFSCFKLLNSPEERDGHDKPTHEEHGAEEMHMDHLGTQLSFQGSVDQVFTEAEAVDNARQVGPELEVIPSESVKCQKPEKAHVESGAEEMHMDHPSTQLSFQKGVEQVFTEAEAVDNARQVGPELEVIPPESVKCQKPENVHVEHGAEEMHMDHRSTQLSFQKGVEQVFTEAEAVDNARQVGPELEVIPPESVKCQKPENVHVEHGAEEMHMDHLSTQLSFQKGVDQVLTEAVDNARQVGLDLEVIPPESVICQKPENARVSILNPHSKLPATDLGTVEVAAVQTPGRKERAKILKKRKALMDLATVVPNKIMKSWIEEDPTDLKRERKEIPHARLQAWRAHKLFHAPHSFLEPSIPGVSVKLCYGCWDSYAPETISAKPSVVQDGLQAPTMRGAQEQILDIRSPIAENSPRQTPAVSSPVAEKPNEQTPAVRSPVEENLPDIRSPIMEETPQQTPAVSSPVAEKPSGQTPAVRSPVEENLPDQIPIAPGTPVAYLNSLRSHEAETVAGSDILEPSSSLESKEKRVSSNEQVEWDAVFQEETSSYKGDSFEKDAFTPRTRVTGSYLGKKFLHKKIRKEEEVLSLSRLLAGKTKKESAIMFYEILVLKTRDCIDAQQETAYRDILLRETPKLRQYLK